jgi:hypothetical protein
VFQHIGMVAGMEGVTVVHGRAPVAEQFNRVAAFAMRQMDQYGGH